MYNLLLYARLEFLVAEYRTKMVAFWCVMPNSWYVSTYVPKLLLTCTGKKTMKWETHVPPKYWYLFIYYSLMSQKTVIISFSRRFQL